MLTCRPNKLHQTGLKQCNGIQFPVQIQAIDLSFIIKKNEGLQRHTNLYIHLANALKGSAYGAGSKTSLAPTEFRLKKLKLY